MESGDSRSQKDTVLTIHISSSLFSVILFVLGGIVSAILVINLGTFLPTRKYISGITDLTTLPNTEVQKFDYGLRNWPVSSSHKPSASSGINNLLLNLTRHWMCE